MAMGYMYTSCDELEEYEYRTHIKNKKRNDHLFPRN